MTRIGLVVVTYSPGESLAALLDSLPAASSEPVGVVLADNGSDDGSVEVASERPGVQLLRTGGNIGYGRAANLGVAALDDDVELFVISNPDLVFFPGALDALADALRRHPEAGAVGPLITDPAGVVYPSARELPSIGTGIGHAAFGWFWPTNPWTRAYRLDRAEPSERVAGWLSGSCLMVRRAAWEAVGGFDPAYFMYFEDVDLGDRLAKAGWPNLYVPSGRVEHVGGQAAEREPAAMAIAHHESAYRYLAHRYHSWWQAPVRLTLRAGLAVRAYAAAKSPRVASGAALPDRAVALPGPLLSARSARRRKVGHALRPARHEMDMTDTPAERSKRVVLFGSYQAADHPRVRVLAEGLVAQGYAVQEVNEPLGLSTSDRVKLLRQPWRLPALIIKLMRCWWRLWHRGRAIRNEVDAVLVGYLGHFDVQLARRTFPGVPILLDHLIFGSGTAVDRGVRPGIRTRLLTRLDRSALSAADIIIVDTVEHAAQVPSAIRDRTVTCLVGADNSWFAAGAARQERYPGQQLRVAFYGLYTPLQGTPVIAEALARLAGRNDLEVTMIGRGQDYQQILELVPDDAPVTWIDWVPASELPELMAEHDLALGIFGVTAKAANVVPNKIFQAAAAGCGLVTSDTVVQRRVLGDAALFVPPGDSMRLAEALIACAAEPQRVTALQLAARSLADRAFTPSAVAEPLVERIATCRTRRPSHR